jgi:UDP-GlcNAc:undecaprenyl-phosphate GlcNAc-1-phosphate transferase
MLDQMVFERGIAAAGVTFLMLWLLQPLAYRLNLLDIPAGRKDHARPTPIIGGLGMAIGIIAAEWILAEQVPVAVRAYTASALLLIVIGLLDDKYDLSWRLRICAQVAAALISATWGGVRIEHLGPIFGLGELHLGALSLPFTVFAVVGLINAVNMIDGVDGLAGSLVLAALLMMGAAGLYAGNTIVVQQTCIAAGAIAAFLWFNLRFPWRKQARMFMGNAGSAFLGFTVAWAACRLTQDPQHPVSPMLALWLVPVPIADCLVLMIRRVRAGRSPFKADHNHVHHLLRDSGFSPMGSVLLLCAFSVTGGLIAAEATRQDLPSTLLLASYVALCVFWYRLTTLRVRAVGFLVRLRLASLVLQDVRGQRMSHQVLEAMRADFDKSAE